MPEKKFTEDIVARLFSLLKETPCGYKEHELLKALSHDDVFSWDVGDHLGMYHAHFILFHCLYSLREQLLREGQYDLHIHCLRIQLLPLAARKSSDQPIAAQDNLSQFYLDWRHLEGVSALDVERMLEQFWRRYYSGTEITEAMALFGLSEQSSVRDVKHTYKRLVMEHHPDRGGTEQKMQEITQAYRVLKQRFQE